jgi:D-3-phosphoglycerate dehydrogenase
MSHLGQRYRVVVTDYPYPTVEPEKKVLDRLGVKFEEYQCKTEDELIRACRGADAILNTLAPMTRKVIMELDRTKIIARHGVGCDNVDISAATEKGIMVTNVPQYGKEEVADHAITLMLAAVRKIPQFEKVVREGRWREWVPPNLRPILSLEYAVLGVLGLGRIGQQVARKAKSAFGMRVLAFDPCLPEEKMTEMGVEPVDLKTLLKSSDVVSIHCPLTKETYHLIDEAQLKLMKKTAFLVNTARGAIVNGDALCRALKEGWIAGAGLDVLEKEPPNLENPLLKLDNVIMTPHVAGYSELAVEDLLIRAAQEVARVLRGKLPTNLVNKEVLKVLGRER